MKTNLITNNLALKLIALMLAIIVWAYVNQELKKDSEPAQQPHAETRS